MDRREILVRGTLFAPFAAMAYWESLARSGDAGVAGHQQDVSVLQSSSESMIPGDDARFLDDLFARCYRYFAEAADGQTGLIADRGRSDGGGFCSYASVAACGFALAAHGAAFRLNLISRRQAIGRITRLLDALVHRVEHHEGWLYHFVDRRDGRRALQSEASTIDTIFAICGAMHASQEFSDDAHIVRLSEKLISRVDWPMMLHESGCFRMGFRPESGLLDHLWDRYSEHLALVLIAMGVRGNGIMPDAWLAWRRSDLIHYQGESFLTYPPLFIHQYSHAFFDFRGMVDVEGRDYFRNSVVAHHAQIEFQKSLAKLDPQRFGHYGDRLWGLTSSDSSSGYRDWGGPYANGQALPERGIDGTVVPSAAGGGLMFVDQPALKTLRYQAESVSSTVYGRYGFVNAFNPAEGWVGSDVIGIDTGITLLAVANLKGDHIWGPFMEHPIAKSGMLAAGFRAMGGT